MNSSFTAHGLKRGAAALLLLALLAPPALAAGFDEDEKEYAPYPYKVPLGLEAPKVPKDNPITDAKVELGKLLYFDKRLSPDSSVSCATCHEPKKGWTDQAAVSTGIRGQKGAMNAPPVFNAAYYEKQFWDGRAASLEEQAMGPIANPLEMGFTHEAAVDRIADIKGYRPHFEKAFGETTVSLERIVQAIASFERTVLSGNAPYDRFNAGDKAAMDEKAQRGLALFFGKGNCSVCHSGPNFSDSDFHNLGVGMDKPAPNLGRYVVSQEERDKGAFKTPTTRNLSRTFPYMHDGSHKTLEEVIDFYDKGGFKNPWLSQDIRPLKLTAQEKADLIAFLGALEGDPAIVEPPKKLPK